MLKRCLPLLVALFFAAGCFDFTAPELAFVGGRCGDGNHLCHSGLSCVDKVCERPGGGVDGDECSAELVCASGFACIAGVCSDPCASTPCGEYGTCTIVDNSASCLCDSGFVEESGRCVGTSGAVCGDIQVCKTGLVCQIGRCAEQCNGSLCENGAVCDLAEQPPVCVCPSGTRLESEHCVNVCTGVTCTGRGSCTVDGGEAKCVCESPYVASGLDCVEPTCVPTSHASQACDSGQVYWYDSCGAREGVSQDCGARGCTTGACNPITWAARDVAFSWDTVRTTDFGITPAGDIIAVAGTDAGLSFKRWRAGSWGDFATTGNTIASTESVPYLNMTLDSTGSPAVAYIPYYIQFVRWSGSSWLGLGGSEVEGTAVSTGSNGWNPSVALDSSGRPMIVWMQYGYYDFNAAARRWDGSAWGNLGSFYVDSTSPGAPIVAFNGAGTPFVASTSFVATPPSFAQLKRWNGTSWANAIDTLEAANDHIGFAVVGNKMAFAVVHNDEITVRRWVDAAAADTTASAGTESTSSDYPSVVIDASGALFIAWQEILPADDGIYVRRFNGASWEDVGAGSSTGRGIAEGFTGTIAAPRIRINNATLCVGWGSNGQTLVMRCTTL